MKKSRVFLGMVCLSFLLAGCGNQNMVNDIAKQQETKNDGGQSRENAGSVIELEDGTQEDTAETKQGEEKDDVSPADEKKADMVDLTNLNSTMVYSEVYNMMAKPEDYVGKQIKMHGNFSVYQSDSGQRYFSCIIQDATQCCAQGLEFEMKGKHNYPDDYPEIDDEITVTGRFDTYEEEGYTYCIIRDAVVKS